MIAAVDYHYRYRFPSALVGDGAGARLRLATSGGASEYPYFFRGRLSRPERAADLLRGLAEVVDARFAVPPSMLGKILRLADPVVTCGGEALRFEAFSQCCSAYARVDLLAGSFEGELVGRGTTNVDFNAPLRAGLARIRAGDAVGLSVGADRLELDLGGETVQERKVALPVRWLRGFVEALACQARMGPRLEAVGAEAHRFFRELPRGTLKEGWIAPLGRGLRLSQRADASAVRVAGVQRLRVLEGLARHANRLRVHCDETTGASAWELDLVDARFTLAISAEPWRGFSGEGQVLETLAQGDWQAVLARVEAALSWDAAVDAATLAGRLDTPEPRVRAALAALGTRGLVGFDLSRGAYFHRVLPFDLELVDALQPRLQAARKLLAAGGVTAVTRDGDRLEAFVAGTGVEHRVRHGEAGWACSCPWFAKHRTERGPCKHVLAVQLKLEDGGE